jgi:hypothetical protein
MLWRPEIMVRHGKEKLPCTADLWGRVVTEVPARAQIIQFRYIPPWKAGFAAGILCLFLAILSHLFIRSKTETTNP